MKAKILLVDQPFSKCTSLFVNNIHIMEEDKDNDFPVVNVAKALADALDYEIDSEIEAVTITQEELAKSIVKHNPHLASAFNKDIASGEIDYDEYTQGYSNDDILKLLNDA